VEFVKFADKQIETSVFMDKNSYALGMSIAHNLLRSGVTALNFVDFIDGLRTTFLGQPTAMTFEEAGNLLNDFFDKVEKEKQKAGAEIAEKKKAEGEAWLKANAAHKDVTVLPSGLQYKVIKAGEGRKPGPSNSVKCHYEGTFPNGEKFDSSYDRKEPAVFGVTQVISGWTEALQLMNEGSIWELYIPYTLAYGERGAGDSIPPCAALKFKVELIEVL